MNCDVVMGLFKLILLFSEIYVISKKDQTETLSESHVLVHQPQASLNDSWYFIKDVAMPTKAMKKSQTLVSAIFLCTVW